MFKRIFFLLLILSQSTLFAFHSEQNIDMYNKIIKNNQEIKDNNLLQNKFKALKSKDFNEDYINVIYLTLKANNYCEQYDNLNTESKRLLQKAITIANQSKDENLILFATTNFGSYYYKYSDYTNAYPLFIKASKIIDSNKKLKILNSADILIKNAYFFGSVDDNIRSIEYLQRSLADTQKSSQNYSTILNNIAQSYIKLNNLDKAKEYLNRSIYYSKTNNNQIRYAKALGDLALIYKKEGDYNKAINYLKKDIELSEQLNEYKNVMYAKILLSQIYLDKKDYDNAEHTILEAKNYTEDKAHFSSFLNDIYDVLLQVSIIKKDEQKELIYRRALSDLKEQLSQTNGNEVVDKINWQIQKDNIEYKLEREITNSEKAIFENRALVGITTLLISSIAFMILFFRKRIKEQTSNYENKVLKLRLQKLESEKQLNEKISSLKNYKTYLSIKNKQILNLKNEIEDIKTSKISHLEEKNGRLNDLLESHLMTESNWLEFKNLFIQEQADYYYFLTKNFTGLTESNLRIIFLQRLGFNNSDTARILGITIDAVKKAKQRLRKKYNENYEDIFSFENK